MCFSPMLDQIETHLGGEARQFEGGYPVFVPYQSVCCIIRLFGGFLYSNPIGKALTPMQNCKIMI